MSNDVTSVLLVEDSAADAYLLRKFLATVKHIELTQVECLNEAIDCLQKNNFDAVLLDLSLPDSRGLNTVKRIHGARPKVAILVLTGLDDEEVAIAALREGAQDYLIKGDIQRTWLVRAINYAIERQQNLDKLQHLNAELTRSNQELEQFAYVVSHDLQQPLQGIFGYAKILAHIYHNRPDEPVNQYIDQIINASQHMSQLIQDLLAYARVDQAKQACELTDCNQVVQQVLTELQPSIHESHAVVTKKMNYPPSAPIKRNSCSCFKICLVMPSSIIYLSSLPMYRYQQNISKMNGALAYMIMALALNQSTLNRSFRFFNGYTLKKNIPVQALG